MNVKYLSKMVCLQTCFLNRISRVVYSTKHGKESKSNCAHDLVGDPNPLTNLRPIKFHIPDNETEIERRYRLKREEVQRWNDQFWQKHNTYFFKKKAEYVKSMKKSKAKDGDDNNQTVTADEMSSFYAQFLNDNWNRHLLYNFEWYKNNASLVLLSLQVKWSHLKNRIFFRKKKTV